MTIQNRILNDVKELEAIMLLVKALMLLSPSLTHTRANKYKIESAIRNTKKILEELEKELERLE